jgi:hypothetical protein
VLARRTKRIEEAATKGRFQAFSGVGWLFCDARSQRLRRSSGICEKGSVNHYNPPDSLDFALLRQGLFVRSRRPHRAKMLKLYELRLLSTISRITLPDRITWIVSPGSHRN